MQILEVVLEDYQKHMAEKGGAQSQQKEAVDQGTVLMTGSKL